MNQSLLLWSSVMVSAGVVGYLIGYWMKTRARAGLLAYRENMKRWLCNTSSMFEYWIEVQPNPIYDSFALKLDAKNIPAGWIEKDGTRVELDSNLLYMDANLALNKACVQLSKLTGATYED